MKNKYGFTIMELLVVIAIIAILSSFVVSASQMARKRGAIAKAKSAIASLEAAINMYEMDIGIYPDGDNKALVKALADESTTDPDWNGPYMRFKEKDLEGSIPDAEFLDPWGNPYIYINPGINNTSFYDIYSYGPDGKDNSGGGDDINNW